MTKKNNNKMNKYHFILEQTSVVPHSSLEVLEETKTESGAAKCIFRARLQEANVTNQNKRKYSPVVCESIAGQLSPKASGRNLLMEIDHPMFGAGDPMQQKRRAAVVEIKNCGALLRDVTFKDNQVIGEIETLSGFRGPDLANLILKDKVDIGFSLRALGSVEPMIDGTLLVKTPIMPITYDVVSAPSHRNSKVMEFIPESAMEFDSGQQAMYESNDLTLLEAEDIFLSESNHCISRFLENIIEERFSKIVAGHIRFKI
jgi:hypothetical protein